MRINEVLSETFDRPYPLSWNTVNIDNDKKIQATTRLDDNSLLEIEFDLFGNGEKCDIIFKRSGLTRTTGEGDSQRVFSTVLMAIQEFLKKNQPDRITFTASKHDSRAESRSKLYTKMIQRYAPRWGYDLMINDISSSSTSYILNRLKT